MSYQIDQSGKIEDTSKDTVLALAGKNIVYSIRILAKSKRQLQIFFADRKEPKLFVYKTFSVGVFILLNAYNMNISSAIIDREYIGHEQLLSTMINKLLHRFDIGSRIKVSFGTIGKKSPAHILAYNVATRKQRENRRVSGEEIKKIVSYLSPE